MKPAAKQLTGFLPTLCVVVAPNGNDTTGNGSWLWPYATLQKAVDVVNPAATTQAEYEQETPAIVLLPGSYAGATIRARRLTTILALGRVTLSTILTWDLRNADRFTSTLAPSLNILGVGSQNRGTFGFRIAGLNVANLLGDAITQTCVLQLEKVDWTAALTDVNANTNTTLSLVNCRIPVAGIVYALADLQGANNLYNGALSLRRINEDIGSHYTQDVTITAVPTAGGRFLGMMSCSYIGARTWTGPASSVLLDFHSNYSFKLATNVLAGGATKVLTGDDVA